MSSPYAMVRGRVIRVTRLSDCGALTPEGDYVVSKAVASVALTEKTYTHAGQVQTSAMTDEIRTVTHDREETIGYTADITLLHVDPEIINIVSGNEVIRDVNGAAVGVGADAGVQAPAFALEIWSKLAGSRCGDREWGYTLLPYLKGAHMTGFTIQNGLATISLPGAMCMRGSKWGDGLYKGEGFGLDPMGLGPFGSVDGYSGGYGDGPFGLTPFDTTDVPGVDLTPYNRFFVNCLVNGHPAPNRRIIAATSA